jgi:uncharacterized protein with HEPN domain
MLDCIGLIQRYLHGLSEADFGQDQEKQDAVARRLEILGEAAQQLPAEWKAQHPGAPWRVIADTRNRLIHGYFSIDVGIVWRTVTQDLTPLEQELRQILASEFPPPSAP